jgi:hypothetical protein
MKKGEITGALSSGSLKKIALFSGPPVETRYHSHMTVGSNVVTESRDKDRFQPLRVQADDDELNEVGKTPLVQPFCVHIFVAPRPPSHSGYGSSLAHEKRIGPGQVLCVTAKSLCDPATLQVPATLDGTSPLNQFDRMGSLSLWLISALGSNFASVDHRGSNPWHPVKGKMITFMPQITGTLMSRAQFEMYDHS